MNTQYNKFKQWNEANNSLAESIICALECISKYNYKAIIKYLPNDEHETPLKEVNDELKNHFNWRSICTFNASKEEIQNRINNAKSETEKDLIKNYTPIFGEEKAIKLYQEKGICTKNLFKGMGKSTIVKTEDMIKFYRDNGEEERAKLWENPNSFFNCHLWQPKEGISYWQNVKGINTYAVYFEKNEDCLNTDELKQILDESIKLIIN